MTDESGAPRQEPSERPSLWARFRRPPNCSLRRLLIVGVILGIVVWGGLNTGMEYTNHSEFCISCHEMTIPYEELKKTVHYSNRTGTTVACADCHVANSKNPIDYGRKFTMKVLAARDIIGHLRGIVDTPEKFEAHRLDMAKRVWQKMKDADSKECRNCHNFDTMDLSKQKSRSKTEHEDAREEGKTCIDCHKGIAHKRIHHLLEEEEANTAKKEG
jgi:cytochrome c-type protein NapC